MALLSNLKKSKIKIFAGNLKNNKLIDIKKEKLNKLINLIDKDNIKLIQFFIESFKKSINHPEIINALILKKIQG